MSNITERLSTAIADRYRIEREVGAGGMATVYLAHDVKHNRKVALKLLKPELGAVIGADRFLKEINVTASLQHPHILQLYDSGEADGLLFYVMPFVEGESLRERIDRDKQLSVEDAVEIARSVAHALDYAHRREVVHRDIKPENILLVDDQPVVADFGIALAVSEAGGARLTETGLSLGTPHYMSPEQAMGDRAVDARSDVYALGCVLYEMLVGDPPYTGSTAQAIIAQVITEKPKRVTLFRDTIPQELEEVVNRSLAKLPADRFATAHEFADALHRPSRVSTTASPPISRGAGWTDLLASTQNFLRSRALAWVVAATLLVVVGYLAVRAPAPVSSATRVVRLTALLPRNIELTAAQFTFSPDGTTLVVSGGEVRQGRFGDLVPSQLFARNLIDGTVSPISGTAGGTDPVFAPDGRSISFRAAGKLKRVPLEGGTPIDIADAVSFGTGWGADDNLVFARDYQSGLLLVPAAGGEPQVVTRPDLSRGELGHWWPQMLPDGKHVLFTVYRIPADSTQIDVVELDTGERRTLVSGGVTGRYVSSGHLLFARNGVVLAAPFDLDRLEVTGPMVPVIDNVAVEVANGYAAYAVSSDGTLAYLTADDWIATRQLVSIDTNGIRRPILDSLGSFNSVRISPDGRRAALTTGAKADVWVLDLARKALTRLTRSPGAAQDPVWSADGQRVYYAVEQPQYDLFQRAADGGTPEELLLSTPNDKIPHSVSSDGRLLLFVESVPNMDIWVAHLDSDGPAEPLIETSFDEDQPQFSPNGRWIAYQSEESGRNEVYVIPYPVTGARRQVSTDGGSTPRWAPDGRALYYLAQRQLWKASFNPASGIPGTPTSTVEELGPAFGYDLYPDGRVLAVAQAPDRAAREVQIVMNWFDELIAEVGK